MTLFSRKFAVLASLASLALGFTAISAGTALADDKPTTGTVSGGGSGGNAVVTNIADLNQFPPQHLHVSRRVERPAPVAVEHVSYEIDAP